MILADNGSAIFISGAPDDRWNNTNLNLLKSITASNFEVVQQGTIYTPGNIPTGSAPTISSFTANPTSVDSDGNYELERFQQHLQHHHSGRTRARDQYRSEPHGHNHLHVELDQPV